MRGRVLSRAAAVSGVALMLAAGCTASSGGDGDPAGSGDCELIFSFDGMEYSALNPKVHPIRGEPVGEAVAQPCEDQSSWKMSVFRLDAVEPADAVIGDDGSILVRRGEPIPSAVETLMVSPTCDAPGPVTLTGAWLGIIGPDGRTEVDLEPPYLIELHVRVSDPPRYERAELTVEVPASLGRPISREDVRLSLHQGGDISASVRCVAERFVAESVDVPR